MGTSHGAGIIVLGTGHEVEVPLRAVLKNADGMGEELDLGVFEHRKLRLTAIVAQTTKQQMFESEAKKLARVLEKRTWAVMSLVGPNAWLLIFAFEKDGRQRWDATIEDELDAQTKKAFGAKAARFDQSALPYWRMAAELPGKPTRPLWKLGGTPVLHLGKPWVRVGTIPVRFSGAPDAKATRRG